MRKNSSKWNRVLAVMLSAGMIVSSIPADVAHATETREKTEEMNTEVLEEQDEQEEQSEQEEEEHTSDESKSEENKSDENESEENKSDESESEENESDERESEENESDENESEENESDESETNGDVTEENTEQTTEETTGETTTEVATAEGFLYSLTAEEQQEIRDIIDNREKVERPLGYQDLDLNLDFETDQIGKYDDSFDYACESVRTPSKYDLDDNKLVSNIKNQNAWGTCWAFSVMSAAESSYLRLHGEEKDLSETHLVNFFYNSNISGPDGGLTGDKIQNVGSSAVNRGGNNYFTGLALTRWTGAADEAADSSYAYPNYNYTYNYTDINISDSKAYDDILHLENVYWIGKTDRSAIKKAVMEFGSVGMSYYYDEEYDSDGCGIEGEKVPAVYYNSVWGSTNHAVSVVGWDDNYDRTNFQYTLENIVTMMYNVYYGTDEPLNLPKKNGAWLIKNSWGEDYGDDGYFWISYEDASIQEGSAFVFDFADADNYDHNYQYDGSAGVSSINANGKLTAAAVYTASGTQNISAVGVGIQQTNEPYKVQIYKNLENINDPESGELISTTTGRTSYIGFYTIELDDMAIVEKGETFSIVITLSKSGTNGFLTDRTYNNSWINFTASTNRNETFYKEGTSWKDAARASTPCTVRIKAYTNDVSFEATAADKIISEDLIQNIPSQTFTGKSCTPELNIVFDGKKLVKGTDYTATYTDNINVGTAKVTITGKGSYKGTVQQEFAIEPKALTADMCVSQTGTYQVTDQNLLTVKYGNLSLTEGTDYTVSYNRPAVNAGNYKATLTAVKGSNYTGKFTVAIQIQKAELSEQNVTLEKTTMEYTGSALKPAVKVQLEGTDVPASNYSIAYSNNTNAGTGTVTITGKGNCQGKIAKDFQITTKPLSDTDLTVTIAGNNTYKGTELTPKVTVKDGKKTLKANKDYTLVYSNNVAAGQAKVTVSAVKDSNYSGSRTETFTISPKTVKNKGITAVIHSTADNSSYIELKDGKLDIRSSDYDLSIKDNDTSSAVSGNKLTAGKNYDIDVIFKNNYAGTAQIKNAACMVSVSDLMISLKDAKTPIVYTGKAQKPAIVVTDGDKKEVSGKFYSVQYSDNVNAGKGTVTVTGKKPYAGTKTFQFTIQKKVLGDELTVSALKDMNYTGNALTPVPTVKAGRTTLKAGKDFTCSYKSNTNVTYNAGEVTAGATVTVTLSSDYTVDEANRGKLIQMFKIKPVVINKVKAANALYAGEGMAVTTTLTVAAGKLQVPSGAYTVTYTGNTSVNKKAGVSVTAKANGNFTGSRSATFAVAKESVAKGTIEGIMDRQYTGSGVTQNAIKVKTPSGKVISASDYTVSYKNNVNAGNKATVIITMNKDSIYTGTMKQKFTITPASLSNMITVKTPADKAYTGGKVIYSRSELEELVTSKVSGVAAAYNKAYTVSYTDNTDAGTAHIILSGKGNYTGNMTVNFTITPLDISSAVIKADKKVTLGGNTTAYASVDSITCGKAKLVKGKDYTLSYSGATKKGVAVMTVTGVGNYSGSRKYYYVVQ